MSTTIRLLVERSIVSLEALGVLGEEVEDEWTYVTDMVAAQRLRLETIAERRADELVDATVEAAVELAAAETGRIADPHRAIDWLSTFPELVALAIGEPVGGEPPHG